MKLTRTLVWFDPFVLFQSDTSLNMLRVCRCACVCVLKELRQHQEMNHACVGLHHMCFLLPAAADCLCSVSSSVVLGTTSVNYNNRMSKHLQANTSAHDETRRHGPSDSFTTRILWFIRPGKCISLPDRDVCGGSSNLWLIANRAGL